MVVEFRAEWRLFKSMRVSFFFGETWIHSEGFIYRDTRGMGILRGNRTMIIFHDDEAFVFEEIEFCARCDQ